MAGKAIAGSPPAIGNSPTKARIAVTIAKMDRTGFVDPSVSDMLPPRRCRELGLKRVFLVCRKTNTASRRIIENEWRNSFVRIEGPELPNYFSEV
jgi:hypothetical protein